MKKKVLYGVFMALFAFAAIGTLQSCKDDVSDLRVQTEYDVANLKNQLSDVAGILQGQIKTNKDNIAENKGRIDVIEADYAKLSWVLQVLGEENVDAVTKDIIEKGGLMGIIKGALSDIKTNKDDIKKINDALGTKDDPANRAGTLWGRLKAVEAAAYALEADYNAAFGGENAKVKSLQQLVAEVLSVKAEFEKGGRVDLLEQNLAALTTRVDNLETTLNDFISTNVTGVLIQGTDNPIFGNFSLPIGVRSNMLFNWYGENWRTFDIDFPSSEDGFDVASSAINSAVLEKMGLTKDDYFSVEQGAYYGNGKGGISLGKVYLTINPVGVDFNNEKFYIETSAGEAGRLPYGFNVVESNDELAFGYTTRSVENGFYEADVVMPTNENDIKKTDIGLTQTLEAAMEDVVNGGSKKTAGIDILKKLYNLMSGDLKAYGVRYDWTFNNNGESASRSILSQYDLAVATAQPLGFNFLEGRGTSRKVPTFGNVDNFLNRLESKVNGKFKFPQQTLKFKDQPITIGEITTAKVTVTETKGGVNVNVDKVQATIAYVTTGSKTVNNVKSVPADPSDIMEAVNKAIRVEVLKALGYTFDAAGKCSDEEVEAEANIKIDAVLLQMTQEINGAVNDITAKATNTVNSAINKVRNHSERLQQLVDLYNKVANKFNNVLANPNAYLQVAAFYKTSDGYGLLSNDPKSPTQMTAGSGLHLLLSTYTAELIAPAYKKYIAVTAVNGKTDGIAALNTGDILNNVLDGSQVNAVIPVDKWVSGNTYTLTYQAVDYTGRTSTKKFYIKVK